MASIGARTSAEKARGGITSRSIKDGGVFGLNIHQDVHSGAYLRYEGKGQPLLVLADLSAAAAGTDAVDAVAYLPGTFAELHYQPIGTVTVAPFGPTADAAGLDLSLDQTDDEGVNYVVGGLLGPWRTTIKQAINDPIPDGVMFRLKCSIADVSGTDDFAIGFRKAEAPQALFDGYDEAAALNIISGNVTRETILNNAATVTVDTLLNWADGETHEVAMLLRGNGKVEFWFDGEPAPVGAAFQFDADEVVVPFIYFLQAADLTTVNVVELEVARLSQTKFHRLGVK